MGFFDFLNVNEIKQELEKTKTSYLEKVHELEEQKKIYENELNSNKLSYLILEKQLESAKDKAAEEEIRHEEAYCSLRTKFLSIKSEANQLKKNYSELHEKYALCQSEYNKIKFDLDHRQELLEKYLKSNLVAFPFLAGVISDYLTFDLEILAKKLDWGHSVEREKKSKIYPRNTCRR